MFPEGTSTIDRLKILHCLPIVTLPQLFNIISIDLFSFLQEIVQLSG